MRIAKPLLLVSTPVGVAGGVYSAYQFSPGLAFLMAGLIALVGCGIGTLVLMIREEQAAEAARAREAADDGGPPPA
jgi:hypothetical protein